VGSFDSICIREIHKTLNGADKMTFSIIKDSGYWLAKVNNGRFTQCDYFSDKKQAWSWVWAIMLLETID